MIKRIPYFIFIAVIATCYTNCSPSMFKPAGSGSGDFSSTGCEPNCFSKPSSPYTMMTSLQVFSSMLNVTDQNGAISTSMRQEYDARTGSLADNDNLAVINAPLQMATTSMAGEVCNGLLGREGALAAADRKFFNQVDFTRNMAGNSPAAYAAAVDSMAIAFWGRGVNDEERQAMNEFYSDYASSYGATGSAQDQVRVTRKLYLSACSAMLSSFDAFVN